MCYNCYGDIMDNEKISLTRSEYKKLKNNNGKKRKPRWNNIILFIFIVILFIVLIISLINGILIEKIVIKILKIFHNLQIL